MKHLNRPADIDEVRHFLMCAEGDASARYGDPFDRTPLTMALADAECRLIAKLGHLVSADEDTNAFVRRWRDRAEHASADEYPQRRGAILARTHDATWTIGAQLLRSAVTIYDAVVHDAIIKKYRTLGTVTED